MTDTEGATALALVPDPPTLDEALDTFGELTVTDEQRATFTWETAERANWAARKLRALYSKIAAVNTEANAEIQRVETWRESALKPLQEDVEFFEGGLRFHHETNIRRDLETNDLQSIPANVWSSYKGKSQKLLHGVSVAGKKPADKWTFDDDAFIKWADKHLPGAVRRKPAPAPEVDVAAAKAALTVTKDGTVVIVDADGTPMIVEGVTITRSAPEFAVKIEG